MTNPSESQVDLCTFPESENEDFDTILQDVISTVDGISIKQKEGSSESVVSVTRQSAMEEVYKSLPYSIQHCMKLDFDTLSTNEVTYFISNIDSMDSTLERYEFQTPLESYESNIIAESIVYNLPEDISAYINQTEDGELILTTTNDVHYVKLLESIKHSLRLYPVVFKFITPEHESDSNYPSDEWNTYKLLFKRNVIADTFFDQWHNYLKHNLTFDCMHCDTESALEWKAGSYLCTKCNYKITCNLSPLFSYFDRDVSVSVARNAISNMIEHTVTPYEEEPSKFDLNQIVQTNSGIEIYDSVPESIHSSEDIILWVDLDGNKPIVLYNFNTDELLEQPHFPQRNCHFCKDTTSDTEIKMVHPGDTTVNTIELCNSCYTHTKIKIKTILMSESPEYCIRYKI